MANKKLNRTSEHRKALLKNMLNSLIKYEQIKTTLPKAKFLKPQADKIITLGKKETLQTTKMLVSQLQDIKSANKVKKTLSKRYEKRNGGYTRIIKAGFRYGDNAPMAIIEFVDRDVAAKALKIVRNIMLNTKTFKKYEPEEYRPGSHITDVEELVKAASDHAQTIFHPVGTCKMGKGDEAVVNDKLQAHGIQNLRVVDASIMPNITSGNTNAPTIMIAEKASDMILNK